MRGGQGASEQKKTPRLSLLRASSSCRSMSSLSDSHCLGEISRASLPSSKRRITWLGHPAAWHRQVP